MKQVICINWGTKYGAPFVNRLYAMVARNITPPFSFTCFCDDPAGFRPEIATEPLPPIDYELPTGGPGIWPKSRLWGPRLGSLSGPVLFLDLDLLIRDSLDPFFAQGAPEDVILARNQSTPFERLGQTSVFRFPVGGLVALQDKFRADPHGIAARYRFEQRFVTRNVPGGVKLFPREWVAHFRQDCRWPFPLNYALAPSEPDRARIVIFPGGVHPQHAIEGRYGAIHRAGSPLEHIARAFSPDRPEPLGKHLRHYMRPAEWVARYWRE
ncbi:glycosyl transferase [Palleronia sediminis]|uniref:Glycosyl transferase n=1 Tax=Palleronia sediminis TaxID=2547833 RepID=A0A4R6AIU0_9RHOB|nr:glycosyl transferase [Palleronia sediminis]TDL81303.1 glycosyl transferase [Palleronia sediminis]